MKSVSCKKCRGRGWRLVTETENRFGSRSAEPAPHEDTPNHGSRKPPTPTRTGALAEPYIECGVGG